MGPDVDHASLLVLRALAGETGKVEIGGRRFSVSCVSTFRLRDEVSGRQLDCRDTASLLRAILALAGRPHSPPIDRRDADD